WTSTLTSVRATRRLGRRDIACGRQRSRCGTDRRRPTNR
ncbi:MAG: hypothetical protein AVDCRST_MAG87-3000, partial [uncultured Thermomicrobiales bacterium]